MTTWKYGYSRPPLPASTILNLELTPLTVWDTSPSIYYRVAQTSSVTSKYPNSHISTPFPHRINRTLKKKRENRSVNIRRQYIKSSLSSSHPLGGTWNSWRAWRHFWGSVRRSMESGGGERGLWGKPGALPQKGLGGVNCCPQGRVRLDGALLGRLKWSVELDVTHVSYMHLLWRNHVSKNYHSWLQLEWGLGYLLPPTGIQPVRQP